MAYSVIKYFGTSCAPCKAIEPIFKKVQDELEEEGFTFESRSIEDDGVREEARTFGIRGVPTIIVFDENKNPVGFKTGMQTEDMLRNFILSTVRGLD